VTRVLSAAGLHEIASFEGFSPVPYNDGNGTTSPGQPPAAGNATIGYGRLLHLGPLTEEDVTHWGRITVDQGLAMLRNDTAYYARAVDAAVKVRLGLLPGRAQCRFDQLVCLAFNIGVGAFTTSSLLREINLKGAPRKWQTLGPYWLEWDHDAGGISQGLLNRRTREFAQFASGKYAT
jgi:GH24 family phage-related lysozyme (muramidase)